MSGVLMCTAHGGAFYTAQGRAPYAIPYFYPCPRCEPRACSHVPRTANMLVRMQGSRPSSAPAARIAPRAPLPFLWVGCAPGLAPGRARSGGRLGPKSDFHHKSCSSLGQHFCRGRCNKLTVFIHCATAVTKWQPCHWSSIQANSLSFLFFLLLVSSILQNGCN